jgi:hypothetical protein
MSRQKGLFPISGNFETRLAAPLDTRLVANTVSNLTDVNYWKSDDNNVYLYKGIAVSVWNDTSTNNGIYVLTNDNYQVLSNWLKISDISLVDSDTISFTQSGTTFLSSVKNNSLDTSKLKTVEGSPTASYILANDGLGNFKWVAPAPSEGSVTMMDFNTGEEFSGVEKIIIRGGSVTVPGGTATGSLASSTASSIVTVWIPAPDYSDLFSPTLLVQSTPRFISSPSNNFDAGATAGEFGIGTWNITNDFTSNTTRLVTNSGVISSAFLTNDYFNCYGPSADGTGTTMSFRVYNSSNNIVSSIENFVISENNTNTNQNITILVDEFLDDNDRKKAKVSGSINIGNIIPNGGRFYYNITHYNGKPGDEILSFTSSNFFFDAPSNQIGSNSTANISGDITFFEGVTNIKYHSGVAYYDNNTTFGVTVSGINLLNEITFPTDRQIQLTANNMPINSGLAPNINLMRGLANGSKGPAAITGWSIDWNSTSLTFSTTAQVNQSNVYIPGFTANNSNVISLTASSNISSDIFDYGVADSKTSLSRLMLFDTTPSSNGTHNNNPIIGEGNRLSVSNLLNGGGGSLSFVSNSPISGDELQYIFGRIIYPQYNFNLFSPLSNTSVDYSNLSASNKTFEIYTNLNTGSTTNINIDDFRWYVTNPYGVNSSYNVDFSSAVFTFNSNFIEDDLHYKPLTNTNGNGDLVIIIGVDPVVNSDRPSKFINLTDNYPGRFNTPTYNFDDSTKKIEFNLGQILGVRKAWLFIGFKNSTRGKNLILRSIQFE